MLADSSFAAVPFASPGQANIAIAITDTYPDVNLLVWDAFFSAVTVTDLAVIVERELNKPHLSAGPIGQKGKKWINQSSTYYSPQPLP